MGFKIKYVTKDKRSSAQIIKMLSIPTLRSAQAYIIITAYSNSEKFR